MGRERVSNGFLVYLTRNLNSFLILYREIYFLFKKSSRITRLPIVLLSYHLVVSFICDLMYICYVCELVNLIQKIGD
jgi:hypothetical protein